MKTAPSKKVIKLLSETIKKIEDENPKVNQDDINKEIYHERMIKEQGSLTLESIGKKHNSLSRERIRQRESDIKESLINEFNEINKSLNTDICELFDEYGKVLFIEELEHLNVHKKIIKSFFYEQIDHSNRLFNIDIETRLIYDINLNLNALYQDFINQVDSSDKNFYTKKELNEFIQSSILNIAYDIEEQKRNQLSIILFDIIVNNKFQPHFCSLAPKEPENYIYSKKKLNKHSIKQKRFLHFFKSIYPKGVKLPQEKEKEKIFTENIKPLIKSLPEFKNHSPKSLYNKIVKEGSIIDYDSGCYIHSDFLKNIYSENATLINKIINEISNLFDDGCNEINSRKLFDEMKNDFIHSNIKTYEILYYLMKLSNTTKLTFRRKHRTLLIGNPNIDENSRKEHKGRLGKSKCSQLKEVLTSSKPINSIDFNVENNQHERTTVTTENTDQSFSEELIKEIENEKCQTEKCQTDREAIIKQRIGQSTLRKEILKKVKECQICGLKSKELLVISHIKPWCESNKDEKLDPNNILLLCPNHDSLFDKGYISFNDKGVISISSSLNEQEQALLGIHDDSCINNKITASTKDYLKWHSTQKFKK